MHEENELDIKVLKLEAQLNLLKELVIENQSEIEELKPKKKPRKKKSGGK